MALQSLGRVVDLFQNLPTNASKVMQDNNDINPVLIGTKSNELSMHAEGLVKYKIITDQPDCIYCIKIDRVSYA